VPAKEEVLPEVPCGDVFGEPAPPKPTVAVYVVPICK
jgi:hypothetical protein